MKNGKLEKLSQLIAKSDKSEEELEQIEALQIELSKTMQLPPELLPTDNRFGGSSQVDRPFG